MNGWSCCFLCEPGSGGSGEPDLVTAGVQLTREFNGLHLESTPGSREAGLQYLQRCSHGRENMRRHRDMEMNVLSFRCRRNRRGPC